MTILIPTLLLVLTPQAAPAPSADTANLIQSCRSFTRVVDHHNSHEDVTFAGFCPGYIQGYFAGIELFGPQHTLCASQATLGTVAHVYTAFMDRNPRLLDYPPEVGFFGAMLDSYPCPAPKKP